MYIDFWASWCPSCAESFPYLNQMRRELKSKGLEVIVVNLDEKPEDALHFLSKHPSELTVLVDTTKQCARDFNVEGMPASYIIDRQGVVRHVQIGFKSDEAQKARDLVEKLLDEKS